MAEDKPKISTIIHAPGIPVAKKALRRTWFVTWSIATALFCFSIYIVKLFVYVDETIPLPDDPSDLTVDSTGCDVTVETAHGHRKEHQIRLRHWTFMGTSSHLTNGTAVTVNILTTRRLATFRCSVSVSPKPGYVFEKVKVNTHKDEYALVSNGPSNVAEMMAVDLYNIVVKGSLVLNILSTAQTRIMGVQAGHYFGKHAGGTLDIAEIRPEKATEAPWKSEKYKKTVYLPKTMRITLSEATLGLKSHNYDLKMHINHDTVDNAILAAGSQEVVSHSTTRDTFLLTTGDKAVGDPIQVELDADNCAVYVQASNAANTEDPSKMVVRRGSSMDQPKAQLLPSGVEDMKKLSKYLNETDPVKFAAYIALTAPHFPTGTLRLLSTSAFKAFPLSFYTIISLGMIQPELIRIQTPIVGFDFLFPRATGAPLTPDETKVFIQGIFDAVSPHVNTSTRPECVWIWDPAGPDAYIFEFQQAMRNRPARWFARLLTNHDYMPIIVATWITIVLGAIIGFLLIAVLWTQARPHILKKLREVSLVNSASYQLQHVMLATDWTVTICTVSYPLDGILLRWKGRPLANLFGKFVVVAQKWPLSADDKGIKIDNIEAWRLPAFPSSPDQQVFLFPTDPSPRKLAPPMSLSEYEAGLFTTAMLGAGNPRLPPGSAYQFQIEAWAGDKIIEKSAWSRPINILPKNAFTDFPLNLWKAQCGVIPEDTFMYFLEEFCVNVCEGPSLQLKLANMRLCIVNSSVLFAGSYTTYGQEISASASELNTGVQNVTIAVSTGSDAYEMSVKDNMWIETRWLPLPAGTDPIRGQLKDFTELVNVPASKLKGSKIPPGKHYFVLDYNTIPSLGKKDNKKETLTMRVGSDMKLQKMQIEARLQDASGEWKGSATYENSWEELARSVLEAPDKEGSNRTTKELSTELILSYGISPDAVLLGDITFENSHVAGPLNIPTLDDQGGLFTQIIPGMTFLWGEGLPFKWKQAHLLGGMKEVADSQFDVFIESAREGYEKFQKTPKEKEKPAPVKTMLAKAVPTSARKVRVFMLPEQPNTVFCMKCKLEARGPDRVLATSPDFVVVKPVTMQEIELGYASFCVRNNIDMMKVSKEHYESTYFMDLVEREFNIIEGYRRPLPIKSDGADPESDLFDNYDGSKGPSVVENEGCYMITGPDGIWWETEPPKDDKKKAAGPSSSSSKPSDVEAKGSEEEAKPHQVAARLEHIDIPTNLFWRINPDWKEHLLLHYSLLPFIATDGALTAMFKRNGWMCFARIFTSAEALIRTFLRLMLYLVQLYIISLPAWLIFFVWVLHDDLASKLNPNLDPTEEAHTTYLFSVLVSPSVFGVRELNAMGRSVFFVVFTYFLVAIIGIWYGNFVHAYRHWPYFFAFFNNLISVVCIITLYATCMYLTIVTVWMVMGAMVDPGPMMIYAIAIVGIMLLIRTLWTHTSMQREQIGKQLSDKMDKVTNVMMDVFVTNSEEGGVTPEEFKGIVSRLIEDMRAQEKNVIDRLYKQADKIIKDTDAWEKTVTVMIRNSDEFKAMVGGTDKCYSTDFVGQRFWKEAQAISNEDMDIKGKRKPPLTTPPFSVPDELITPEALSKARAMEGLDTEGDLTTLNGDDEAAVQFVSKVLGLRPTTGTLCHKAFKTGVESLSNTTVDLLNPLTMATFFAQIRNDQLFRHFLWDEPNKEHFLWNNPEPPKKEPPKKEGEPPKNEEDAAAAAEKLAKDKAASVSAVYLLDMQRQDLLNIEPVLADNIVALTDWHQKGELIIKFMTRDLNIRTNHTAEAALNPCEEGSAAFKVMLKVYEYAFPRWPEYDETGKGDPALMFLHSGVVDEQTFKSEACQGKIKTAIDMNRYVDGSMDASCLINAMKWATSSNRETEDITGIVYKKYLWYGALVHMLEELGWSQDEMEEKWLKKRWSEVTEDTGFFLYRDMDELTLLITGKLSEGGLWRGAAKAFMLKAKVGGYIGCDVIRDGKEKAVKNAKAVLWGDQTDMKFLNDTLVWPDWAEELWQKYAKFSSESRDIPKAERPKFIDLTWMVNMLQHIVFLDDSRDFKKQFQTKDKGAYQMNMLSADPEVIKFWKMVDGRIWYQAGQAFHQKSRVRGLWLELFMEVAQAVKCIPFDIDLYFDSLEWQLEGKAVEFGAHKDEDQKVPWLNLSAFQPWLKWEYIMKKRSCTAEEFHEMLASYFNFKIDADVLKVKVFNPCPLVPDDDNGELRYLHDLGAGLRLWMGYGLWKGAIEQAVKILLPRGKIRILAEKKLSEEFDKLDKTKIGVIQPGQAILLLKRLSHPGLTCEELQGMLKADLNLDIPYRELHKYFTVLDTNGDGVLQVKEFICFIQYIMADYYPAIIMKRMNLTVRQILSMIFVAVLTFVGLIAIIKISISTFTPGQAIGHALQTGGGAISMAYSKISSDKNVGADEAISAVRARVEATLTAAVATTMGLAPASIDKLHQLAKGVDAEL
mmetsp:Transcript_33768/g.62134  ORF Transcript_33768/g.62134 Transcript_33768/m.62134 type:complete len:2455 (-) Transcript_33768:115-7479(-)